MMRVRFAANFHIKSTDLAPPGDQINRFAFSMETDLERLLLTVLNSFVNPRDHCTLTLMSRGPLYNATNKALSTLTYEGVIM